MLTFSSSERHAVTWHECFLVTLSRSESLASAFDYRHNRPYQRPIWDSVHSFPHFRSHRWHPPSGHPQACPSLTLFLPFRASEDSSIAWLGIEPRENFGVLAPPETFHTLDHFSSSRYPPLLANHCCQRKSMKIGTDPHPPSLAWPWPLSPDASSLANAAPASYLSPCTRRVLCIS